MPSMWFNAGSDLPTLVVVTVPTVRAIVPVLFGGLFCRDCFGGESTMKLEKVFPSLLLALAMATMNLLCSTTAAALTDLTLYSFTGGSDGGDPLSNLVMDAAGNLYGTTFVGGAYGAGEVFELSHNPGANWTETVLYSFTGGLDGANPYYSGVIFDASGNLYGTTVGGGTSNLGTVFELTPTESGWSEKVLYSFAAGLDGASPYAGLVFNGAGSLYGTSYAGGAYDDGTVFELTPTGKGQWIETVIHTFNETNGSAPAGELVFDRQGNLYGVTQGGGNSKAGVAFELVRSSTGRWTGEILHSFTGGSDGSSPYTERLVLDALGNLYGTTIGGGASQLGTVFRLSRNAAGAWREVVLYSFNGALAANPYSGLILDGNGNLYGTCANGNGESTVGAVFELSLKADGNWSENNLLLFTRQNGEFPEGSLVADESGNLYGTTWLGGAYSMGVVFEITH
jgi:uncharacterized repeat protein (TIGR03803 family)